MKRLLLIFATVALAAAARAGPITSYPNASSPLSGAEQMIGTQAGATVQVSSGQIATLANSTAGNVTGPGSATVGHLACWNAITGKLLADCGSASAGGAVPVINAKTYPGVICDGVTRTPNDGPGLQAAINAAVGSTASPNGQNGADLNIPWHLAGGHCIITTPLTSRSTQSAIFYGDGPQVSEIENVTPGSSVWVTNGANHTTFQGMFFYNSGTTGSVFQLDWDDTGSVDLASNTIRNMLIGGGAYGLNIGPSGYMGSETLIEETEFDNSATACVITSNFNALNNSIHTGSFDNCYDGVVINEGGMSVYDSSISNSVDYDVVQNNNSQTTILQGVRSESVNFYKGSSFTGNFALLLGDTQDSNTNGTFALVGAQFEIDDSYSLKGQVVAQNSGTIRNSTFGRSDWINTSSIANDQPLAMVEAQNVTTNTNATASKIVDDRWVQPHGVTAPKLSYVGQAAYLTIASGSGSVTLPIPPNSRVTSVSLVLDTAGSGGTITVGDAGSSTRYFSAQSLTGSNAVSTVTNFLYSAQGLITATSASAVGVTGYIKVDYQVLN